MDVCGLSEEGLRSAIGEHAQLAAGRLAPAAGLMLQAVWFDAGAAAPGRLLLSIHHLAVDGVSWRILVPDLAAAWRAVAQGQSPLLGPRSSSLRRWAERLVGEAHDQARLGELELWCGMLSAPCVSLVEGKLDAARDVGGTAGHLRLSLPACVTAALLTRVPAAFHGGINDVLLSTLGVALLDWRRRRAGDAGGGAVLIDVEGHGREDVFADVDLSRTVGWFTSLYPVRLDLGGVDLDAALAGGAALGRALKLTKEQLRAVRDNGLGYGLLRYLNRESGGELAKFAPPQIGFNYLGRFGGSGADWSAAGEGGVLGGGDAAMPLAHCIEVNALTVEECDGATLSATWSWAPALVSEEAVGDLARSWFRALSALVRHAAAPGAGGRSPSDLPLLALSQDEIEDLERQYPQLEEILPLSPLQQGLLFHALYDAQAADVYTVQLVLALRGALDRTALQAAVAKLLARHASLRAGFRQGKLRHPVQVIVRGCGAGLALS